MEDQHAEHTSLWLGLRGRVFHNGQIEATLIPELWLLDGHHTQLSAAAAGAVDAQRLGAATFSVSEVGDEP